MPKIVDDWLERAYEDIEVAHECYGNRHYLHTAHLCQQSVEKALKALLEKNGVIPPHIHKLERLAVEAKIWDLLEPSRQDLLVQLSKLYSATKYPDVKARLSKSLTPKATEQLLKSTKEVLVFLCRRIRDL